MTRNNSRIKGISRLHLTINNFTLKQIFARAGCGGGSGDVICVHRLSDNQIPWQAQVCINVGPMLVRSVARWESIVPVLGQRSVCARQAYPPPPLPRTRSWCPPVWLPGPRMIKYPSINKVHMSVTVTTRHEYWLSTNDFDDNCHCFEAVSKWIKKYIFMSQARVTLWLHERIPASTKHLYNICTMVGQRRIRWVDFVQCCANILCLLGYWLSTNDFDDNCLCLKAVSNTWIASSY